MPLPRRPALLLPALAAALAAGAIALRADEEEPTRQPASAPSSANSAANSGRSDGRGAAARGLRPRQRIRWRASIAAGSPAAGRLIRGVRLPAAGAHFFTWDPVKRRSPNRHWRRWGTDRLVRLLLAVAREYHRAHPAAPRMAIGDLSRPHGGDFGPQYGYIGHSSHQNGLDADVYYPRSDSRERAPKFASQIDRRLSQELVDRFTAAGATAIFVGPGTGLSGPPGVVQVLANHDNHLHVRISAEPSSGG